MNYKLFGFYHKAINSMSELIFEFELNVPVLICVFILGGRNSTDCTLILTEGDSAKTLAVSGLGVVGRDKYGVFPLRGKILNVREASHKQVEYKNYL